MVAEYGPSGMEFDEAKHLLVTGLNHFLQHKDFVFAFVMLASHSRCNEDDILEISEDIVWKVTPCILVGIYM